MISTAADAPREPAAEAPSAGRRTRRRVEAYDAHVRAHGPLSIAIDGIRTSLGAPIHGRGCYRCAEACGDFDFGDILSRLCFRSSRLLEEEPPLFRCREL